MSELTPRANDKYRLGDDEISALKNTARCQVRFPALAPHIMVVISLLYFDPVRNGEKYISFLNSDRKYPNIELKKTACEEPFMQHLISFLKTVSL